MKHPTRQRMARHARSHSLCLASYDRFAPQNPGWQHWQQVCVGRLLDLAHLVHDGGFRSTMARVLRKLRADAADPVGEPCECPRAVAGRVPKKDRCLSCRCSAVFARTIATVYWEIRLWAALDSIGRPAADVAALVMRAEPLPWCNPLQGEQA